MRLGSWWLLLAYLAVVVAAIVLVETLVTKGWPSLLVAGLTVPAFLFLIQPTTWHFQRVLRLTGIVLMLVAYAGTYNSVGKLAVEPAFFEVAAQVIPVLLLAVVIEARPFRARSEVVEGVALVLSAVGLLAFAEFEALRAVALGHPGSSTSAANVSGAMAAGVVAVAVVGLGFVDLLRANDAKGEALSDQSTMIDAELRRGVSTPRGRR